MSSIAVIKTGGKQYTVSEGDVLKIEKLEGKEGSKLSFSDVLLVCDSVGKQIELGTPFVKGKKVAAEIVRQFREKKILVVKYKAKVRYRKAYGHRQHKTEVKITSIA